MKKLLLCITSLVLFVAQAKAQKTPIQNRIDAIPQNQFHTEKLFSIKSTSSNRLAVIKQYVNKFVLLEVNDIELNKISNNKPDALEIDIPINNTTVTLQLIKSYVVNEQTIFTSQNGTQQERVQYKPGAYYYGVIKNQPQSIVAISFFNHNIIGVIANEKGNYVVGKSNTADAESNEYIVYNDKDLLIKNTTVCGTIDESVNIPFFSLTPTLLPTKCLRVYIETDYQMYKDHGSNETNVRNFVTGVFNITATLYCNESINTSLSEIKVFTSKDPYATASNTADALNAFGNAMKKSGFNGDLAHLLSARSLGGGRANLNSLCKSHYYRTAVSGDLLTYTSAFPTYSWNANVVTHEMGHNLGSPHTHACVWNGRGTAIDGCGPTYGAGYTPPVTYEGTCSGAPIPTDGGTIMSYCHLGGVSINFSKGFGPQPGNLIRSTVNGAACLASCATGCAYSIGISTPINAAVKYEASGFIVSSSSVTSSGYVVFDAGQQIQLLPGFSVTGSGDFRAHIDGCGGSFTTIAEHTTPPMPENKKPDVDVESSAEVLQVYPNPFTNKLTINYDGVGNNEKASIEIFSITGNRVAVLQQPNNITKGKHSVEWDATNISSGVYIIVLTTDTGKKIQKVVKL